MIAETASAKINLYLHVGAVRSDGLHEIASLFVFADDGDTIEVSEARDLTLKIDGPFAAPLQKEPPEKNLVYRAAESLRASAGVSTGAAIRLDKRLPIASGVGGGSADAAAALRALMKLWKVEMDRGRLLDLAFSLGADVPACLEGAPVEVGGAGEVITPGPLLPPLWACLVNPLVEMPTGPVFREFDAMFPAPLSPQFFRPGAPGEGGVRDLLVATRNDLEPIAIRRQPVIQTVKDRLTKEAGCLGARMSGSGATVFGLFTSAKAAQHAARQMAGGGWWSMSAAVLRGAT